jgi:protein SCO1
MKRQIFLSGIAFCVILLLFGLWSHYNITNETFAATKPLNLQSGTALPTPRQIQAFELKHAPSGEPFTNEGLKGQFSMLFFGFTSCASLCPTTLTTLNQFYANLIEDKIAPLPQVIFISIDPERDSLKRVDQYVTSFNKNFKGVTGTETQLNHITRELNILYAKVKTNKEGDYQIDHSGTVLLINPDGNLIALFSPPLDPKMLAQDYVLLIKQVTPSK